MQKTLIILDELFPRWLVYLIYYPSWYVFKAIAHIHFKQDLKSTYLRNSFYLNYFTFGLSDLDFGIILNKRVSVSTWDDFNRSFLYFKKIFPFWGEINLYTEDELSLVLPFVNSIEAKRDPTLAKLKLLENPSDKIAFLLRSIMTNIPNWSFEVNKKKKFKTYFELCGLKFTKTESVESSLETNLKDLLYTPLQKRLPAFIISFNKLLRDSPDILWDSIFEEQKTFFPHHYLWFERGENDEEFIQNLNQADRDVLISQVYWEVWGLYTQMYYFYGTENFKVHLNRMKRVIALAGETDTKLKKIDALLIRFDEMK